MMPKKPRARAELKYASGTSVPIKIEYVEGASLYNTGLHGKSNRIIVGERQNFGSSGPNSMLTPGVFGSHGTLEMIEKTLPFFLAPKDFPQKAKCVEIKREIPYQYRNMGIGTRLLQEAEKVAREQGYDFIWARTKNPVAVKTYKKRGWNYFGVEEFDGERGVVQYRVYGKKLK